MTYRALLIANSTFPADAHNLVPLEGPRNDPVLLRDALCDRDTGMVAPEQVRIVAERTMAEVLLEIEEFLLTAGRQDTVILYYSGHGLLDLGNELYLAARDTRTDRLRATAVKAADISSMLDDSSAAAAVVVLDCCHSGRFKSGADLPAALAGRGRFVLTASRPGQLAADTDAHNRASVFTHHLVEGLRHGAQDRDGDGYVRISDLYDYVHHALVSTGRQIPHKRFEGDGDVPIARRAARRPDIPLPPAPEPPVSVLRSCPPPPPVPGPAPQRPRTPSPQGVGSIAAKARQLLTWISVIRATPRGVSALTVGPALLAFGAAVGLYASTLDARDAIALHSASATDALLRDKEAGPGLLTVALGAGLLALSCLLAIDHRSRLSALGAATSLGLLLGIERSGWYTRAHVWCQGCLAADDAIRSSMVLAAGAALVAGVCSLVALVLLGGLRAPPAWLGWRRTAVAVVLVSFNALAREALQYEINDVHFGSVPVDAWSLLSVATTMMLAVGAACLDARAGKAVLGAVALFLVADVGAEIAFVWTNRLLAGFSAVGLVPLFVAVSVFALLVMRWMFRNAPETVGPQEDGLA